MERRRCEDYLATRRAVLRADVADTQALALEEMSRTDPLTGLPNRRGLDARLAMVSEASERVSALMLDVDFFKAFNDTYGHATGDECLQRISMVLARVAQQEGLFCARQGGEEFIAVIENRPDFDVLRIAEKLRREVQALQIPHVGRPDSVTGVTISIGVAMRDPGSDKTMAQLIREADAALYDAKARGRNRFVMSGDVAKRIVYQ